MSVIMATLTRGSMTKFSRLLGKVEKPALQNAEIAMKGRYEEREAHFPEAEIKDEHAKPFDGKGESRESNGLSSLAGIPLRKAYSR